MGNQILLLNIRLLSRRRGKILGGDDVVLTLGGMAPNYWGDISPIPSGFAPLLITQYKMINLKLRFWVSQSDNLVYLVLHSAYLIIGTLITYSYHNDASPDGRKVWKKIRTFTSVIMIHQTKRHIYTLRGNKRCRY